MKARSEERRFEKMTRLGVANLTVLRGAREWCKHLSVEMESAGMAAEVTGLPIGSHRISCQHAPRITGGMNLPWILPQFVADCCRGCPYHAPNGDVAWGEGVLREAAQAAASEAHRRAAADRQLAELRARMLSLPRSARAGAEVTEYAILEWVEQSFGDDPVRAVEAQRRLREAARVAPELFGAAAVNALAEGAAVAPFDNRCLPVLAALSGGRPDLDDRLAVIARAAILEEREVEASCHILAETLGRATTPVDPAVVARVIGLRRHIRPVGGWRTDDPDGAPSDSPPDYSASTRFLVKAFDGQPEAVLDPLRAGLADNDKYQRVNTCGVINALIGSRPRVGSTSCPT